MNVRGKKKERRRRGERQRSMKARSMNLAVKGL